MLGRLVMACAMVFVAIPAWAQTEAHGMHRGLTIEASGGYAFTQFNAGPGWPNVIGAYGSVAVNVTPWMQIYGDGIAQYRSYANTSTTIYTNDFGPRFFLHRKHLPVTPFAEFFAGGARLDFNVTTSGTTTKYSQNGFSFKTGGGFDIPLTRRWTFRAIDIDYFNTPFLGTRQSNIYFASGVVYTFGHRNYPR